MKSTTLLPATCGIALATMLAAGASHWWSVRQFLAHREISSPRSASLPAAPPASPSPAPVLAATRPVARPPAAPSRESAGKSQKDFYEALLNRIEHLQNQNSDLLDQIAETNRDMRVLELRVDSHSRDFRPLQVPQETGDPALMKDRAALDFSDAGVLPPRAEPVNDLPTFE